MFLQSVRLSSDGLVSLKKTFVLSVLCYIALGLTTQSLPNHLSDINNININN